jgi:hypothetical protein
MRLVSFGSGRSHMLAPRQSRLLIAALNTFLPAMASPCRGCAAKLGAEITGALTQPTIEFTVLLLNVSRSVE